MPLPPTPSRSNRTHKLRNLAPSIRISPYSRASTSRGTDLDAVDGEFGAPECNVEEVSDDDEARYAA